MIRIKWFMLDVIDVLEKKFKKENGGWLIIKLRYVWNLEDFFGKI